MAEIIYPTIERIVEYNFLAIMIIKVKKADQAKVISKPRLEYILEECKKTQGDIYDKATVLFINIIRLHPFASGNRRTAFLMAKEFLLTNNAKFKIQDDPSQAKIMIGIREGYYTPEEVKEWLKNGKIKEFNRFKKE